MGSRSRGWKLLSYRTHRPRTASFHFSLIDRSETPLRLWFLPLKSLKLFPLSLPRANSPIPRSSIACDIIRGSAVHTEVMNIYARLKGRRGFTTRIPQPFSKKRAVLCKHVKKLLTVTSGYRSPAFKARGCICEMAKVSHTSGV